MVWEGVGVPVGVGCAGGGAPTGVTDVSTVDGVVGCGVEVTGEATVGDGGVAAGVASGVFVGADGVQAVSGISVVIAKRGE